MIKKRPGVSITGRDQGSLHQESLWGRGCSPFSWARGASGSFATSSSHFIENPPACSWGMDSNSSYGGRGAVAPCTACHSSCHRGMLSLDASSHGYKQWQNFCSLHHNMGRTLSAFAGSHHNRRTPEPSSRPHGAGESHTLIHIETTCQEVWRLLRGYLLGCSGVSSSRTPAWWHQLWCTRAAIHPQTWSRGACTWLCDPRCRGGQSNACLWPLVGEFHRPPTSNRKWVRSPNPLEWPFSPSSRLRIRAWTSWTSGRSFSYSLNQAFCRAASEGPVEAVASASLASDSFHTLGGVASSVELLDMALLPCFRSLRGSLTLRLWGGCSSSGVGPSALSGSVLEASLIHSWTCWQGCEVLREDSLGSDTSSLGPPSSGWFEADGTSCLLVEGSAFNTTGGLTTLYTALAILGMKSGSEKIGGIWCLRFFEEFPLVMEIQALRQPHSSWCLHFLLLYLRDGLTHSQGPEQPAPSRDDVGGITLPRGSNTKTPQQSLQKTREEIALKGPVSCHPY